MRRIAGEVACVAMALALWGCGPRLNGTCSTSVECAAGETCIDGICLSLSGQGAGSGGALTILSPDAGAWVAGKLTVAAAAQSLQPVTGVDFELNPTVGGAAVGTLSATALDGGQAGGTIVVAAGFEGPALLKGVLHRSGAADVSSPSIAIKIDQTAPAITTSWPGTAWAALDGGFDIATNVSDNLAAGGAGSGVASAQLSFNDLALKSQAVIAGGAATFHLNAVDVASPGAAVRRQFSLTATDHAGNQSSSLTQSNFLLLVDDEPPTVSGVASSGAAWYTSTIPVSATVDDHTGAGVDQASVVMSAGAASVPANHASGTTYTFAGDFSAASFGAHEGQLDFLIHARDNVGNPAVAGAGSVMLDNLPPRISGIQINTVADGTAGTTKWFRGPHNSPPTVPAATGTTDLDAIATVTDPYLVPLTVVAVLPDNLTKVNGKVDPLDSTLFHFAIPRSIGAGATGPVNVTFIAGDAAGNQSNPGPSLPINFDDVPPAAFAPGVNVDTKWYKKGASLSAPVVVTFNLPPTSGIKSMALAGVTSFTGSGPYTIQLPTVNAPANTEAAYTQSLVVTSVVGTQALVPVTRNVDDAPPSIDGVAIQYPGCTVGDALCWGHDGAHFTVRDSGHLVQVRAHDCGAGLSLANGANLSPSFGSVVSAVATGATALCSSGTAPILAFMIDGDLSTRSFGTQASLDLTATISDDLGHAALLAGQTYSARAPLALTRQLWQAANVIPGGNPGLAVGPKIVLAAGTTVVGVIPSTGNRAWTASVPTLGTAATKIAAVAIGTSGATPVAYVLSDNFPIVRKAGYLASVSTFDAASGQFNGACTSNVTVPTPLLAGSIPNITDGRDALALYSNGDAAAVAGVEVDWVGIASDKYEQRTLGWHVNGGCSPATGTTGWLDLPQGLTTNLVIGRGSAAYFGAETVDLLGSPLPQGLVAVGAGGTGGPLLQNPAACNQGPFSLADNLGLDAILCSGGSKWTSGAGGLAKTWGPSYGAGPFLTSPAIDRVLTAVPGGTGLLSLASGATSYTLYGGTAWLVDNGIVPVVYGSTAAGLEARHLTSAGLADVAWPLPAVPGAVTNMMMDRTGVLYVVSGTALSAIYTDSRGLGAGWPAAGRDACRSSNLEYACPY